MSVQAITWAMKVDARGAAKKAVLICVANYADELGRCWPSVRNIAKQACCSVSTVQRALAAFEADGLLTRSDRRRPDGSFTSDEIFLNLGSEAGVDAPSTPRARRRKPQGNVTSGPQVNLTSGQSDQRSNCVSPQVNLTGLTTFEPNTTLEGSLRSPSSGTVIASALPRATPAQRVCDAVNSPHLDPNRSQGLITRGAIVAGWLASGIPEPLIVETIAAICEREAKSIGSWRYFDAAVRQAAADSQATPILVEAIDGQRSQPYARAAGARPRSVLAAMASDLSRYSGK